MFKTLLKKLLGAKIYVWIVVAILTTLFVVAKTSNLIGYIQGKNASNERSQIYTQITSLEKVNETVFLNVGIQKVEMIEKDKKIPGTNISIPLSVKKAILILNYTAKFGIKEGVKVKKISDHEYELTIPKYEVIGVKVPDDPKERYKKYDTSGQLLSGATEDIDKESMFLKILVTKNMKPILNSIKISSQNRQKPIITIS